MRSNVDLGDGDRVRLFTRNGYDWTSGYPLIVEAARRIRTKQFVLDGEAALLRSPTKR
jgi:bifunctional non-homologous end joining protein LigD